MTEQKTNRTEEQLEQELRKSKGGKLSGKILSMLGVVIAVAGIILGGNLVLCFVQVSQVADVGRLDPRPWADGTGQVQGAERPAGLRCHCSGHRGNRL